MKQRSIAVVLVAALAALFATNLAAQPKSPYAAAIVMEPKSGQVLFADNADTPYPVASMTKMMTLLVVLDAIKQGAVAWNTPVTISGHATKMGGSQVYLKQGETFPLSDLVAATMVHSANDAAMALAEKIAGTDEAFVVLMNQKAQQMGLKNSHFFSPHGLPAEKGMQDDVMSARDAARIGIELMKDPRMAQLAATQQMPFRNGQFTLYNPNHLLRMYPGATGIKTGYHGKAGYCVTGSAHQGNMDLVCVIMGSIKKNENFESGAKLLATAFAQWQIATPIKRGTRVGAVPVQKGAEKSVPVVAGGDVTVLTKRLGGGNAQVQVVPANVTAPVKKGQQVGTIVAKINGQIVGRASAIAAVAVEEEPWWKKFWPF